MPIKKTDHISNVEAKGRNGYFVVSRAEVFVTDDGSYADLRLYSKRTGDHAPLIIKGDPASLKALLGLLYNSIQL